MVNKPLRVCCALWCIFTFQAQAQGTLSLTQLWEQSFVTYPSLKARKAALRTAEMNRSLVRNEYLPQIQVQAQNTLGIFEGLPGAFFPLPGIFNVGANNLQTVSEATNLVGSAVVHWEFLQFGRHRKSVEAAQTLVEQASSQWDEEHLRLQSQVTQDYIDLLFHSQMLRWATANAQRFQDLIAITQSRVRAGLSPGADSLLVKASLQQARADIRHWQGEQEASQERLTKWTGHAPETLQPTGSAFFVEQRILWQDTFPAEHPSVQVQAQRVAYAGKQKELSSRKVFPSVSFLAGALLRGNATIKGSAGEISWYDMYEQPAGNYLVGIGITWNLSRLYDQRLRSNYFQQQVNEQQETLQQVKLNLQEREASALKQIQRQEQQISDAEEAYQAARQAYHLFKARYRSGIIGLTELLQIQQVLQQTEKTRIYTHHQYWLYATELAAARADFSFLAQIFH